MSSSQDRRLAFEAKKLFTVTLLALIILTLRSCADAVSGINEANTMAENSRPADNERWINPLLGTTP